MKWIRKRRGGATAVVSYDVSIDSLRVEFGACENLDMDEVIEDLLVFFDTETAGRLVGVEALSPTLGRSDAWRSVLADYVGETVMRSYIEMSSGAVSVMGKRIKIPSEEWVQLGSHAWPVQHRDLRAKQNLPPLEPRDEGGASTPRPWLRGFTSQARPAYGMRGSGGPDVAALNLELPEAFAHECGVGAICFARFESPVRLELRLDLLPNREPELEAVAVRPSSSWASFEPLGKDAMAILELFEPVESAQDLVVHFNRAGTREATR